MKPSTLSAAFVLAWPSVVLASFNGPIDLPFGAHVVFGVLGALPSALVMFLLEWVGATRPPPSWLGKTAALAAAYCILRLAGIIGSAGDRGLFLMPIPALIELVLITFVRSPRARHAAGWAVAASSILVFALWQVLHAPTGPPRVNGAWGLLIGAALTTALLWRLGFHLGQKRKAGML